MDASILTYSGTTDATSRATTPESIYDASVLLSISNVSDNRLLLSYICSKLQLNGSISESDFEDYLFSGTITYSWCISTLQSLDIIDDNGEFHTYVDTSDPQQFIFDVNSGYDYCQISACFDSNYLSSLLSDNIYCACVESGSEFPYTLPFTL